MLPLRDDNPTRRVPYVTLGLIAANVIVFFTEPLLASDVEQTRFFLCKATLPYEVVHRTTEHRIPYALLGCPGKSVWLSILYSMFLHGGVLHLAGNMLFLWTFGNNVEDRLGRLRYVVFYLAAGVVATLAQSYATPGSFTPLIGASGAVAGVLGVYLMLYPRARVTTLVFYIVTDLPAVFVLGAWFVLQVFQSVGSVQGAGGGVAYIAHVAGFAAGMAVGATLAHRTRSPHGWIS